MTCKQTRKICAHQVLLIMYVHKDTLSIKHVHIQREQNKILKEKILSIKVSILQNDHFHNSREDRVEEDYSAVQQLWYPSYGSTQPAQICYWTLYPP